MRERSPLMALEDPVEYGGRLSGGYVDIMDPDALRGERRHIGAMLLIHFGELIMLKTSDSEADIPSAANAFGRRRSEMPTA